MANAILSYINHVDASATSLTASHEASTDTEIGNVADTAMGKRWRTETLTAHGQADFGSDLTVAAVALFFPRDTMDDLSGSVQHQFDPDGGTAGTGATHDSGAISIGATEGYGYHLYVPSSSFNARYWRWTFSSVSGVTFIDVGRAWAGDIWQPDPNINVGYGDAWDDISAISQGARSGTQYVDERARLRILEFQFGFMDTTDRNTARELDRVTGISKQLLFVVDPDDSSGKEIIIGRQQQIRPIQHRANTGNGISNSLWSKSFRIREGG